MPDGQKVVQVPNLGTVAFPAGMDDASINHAIAQALIKQNSATSMQNSANPTKFEQDNAPGTITGPLREAVQGATTAVIPENQQSTSASKNLSTIGQGLNQQVNTAATTPWGQGGPIYGTLAMLARAFMGGAHGTASGIEEMGKGIWNKDPNAAAHGAGAAGGNLLALGAGKEGGEMAGEFDPAHPVSSAPKMLVAPETLQNLSNLGPAKAAFIDRQVGKAAAVQGQVKPALDALHADGKNLMANVSSHIDAVKPEGVFDKTDVASAVKDALGVVKDQSKVPSSLQSLAETEPAPKGKAPMVNGVAIDPASPNYAILKASGTFTPKEIKNIEGAQDTAKLSFEQLKQIHSDIGRQVAQAGGKGAVEAGVKAAYGKIGDMLRKEAESHGMLDQWQEGVSKVRMFNNIAYRSPLKDTYFGENHGEIMKPLISDDTGPQVKPLLEAISPYGIDTQKLNKTINGYKYGEKMDRLNEPSRMQLMIAAVSPKAAAIRTVLPRAMRSNFMTDLTMGKGLDEMPTVKPGKVYPSKLAAAQQLKGDPTPFGGNP